MMIKRLLMLHLFLSIVLSVFIGCSKSQEDIIGCTNSSACNYNQLATISDDSCVVPNETSCQVCSGTSLVTNDTDQDGVCDNDEVSGCTNSTACNYDETATDDNGSCSTPDSSLCEYCSEGNVVVASHCEGLYLSDTKTYSISVPEYNGSALVAINFDTQNLSYSVGTTGREIIGFKTKKHALSCGTPSKIKHRHSLSKQRFNYKNTNNCAVPSEQSNTQLFYETTNFNVFISQDQSDDVKAKVKGVIDRFESTALVNFNLWWDEVYDVSTYGKINVYFISNTGYLGYVTYQSQYCYFLTMDLGNVISNNDSDNDITMAHEFTHILQNYLYDKLYKEHSYKLWITEGIAEALGVIASEIDCTVATTCSMDTNYSLSEGYGIFGTNVETAYKNAPQFFEYLRIQHGLTGKYHYQFMYEVEQNALITSANNNLSSVLERSMDVLTQAHTAVLEDEQVTNNFKNMYESIVYFNLAKVISTDSVANYGIKFGYNGVYDQSWLNESSGSGTLEQSGALFFGSTVPQITISQTTDNLYYYKINYTE